MKKVSIVFLGILIVFVLSACTKQSTNNTNQNTTTATTNSTSNINSTTLVDVSSHNKPSDCWTIISGVAYNITDYIASGQHPGNSINLICGKDGTQLFNSIAKHATIGNLLDQYKIN